MEMFDAAVNVSPPKAARFAQQAANLVGHEFADLKLDGRVGPKTLAVINRVTSRYVNHLVGALNGYQFAFYDGLWKRRPDKYESFIRGWMLRCLPIEVRG